MAEGNDLSIIVGVNTDNLKDGLRDAENQVKGFANQTKTSTASLKGILDGLTSSSSAFGKALNEALGGTLTEVRDLTKSFIDNRAAIASAIGELGKLGAVGAGALGAAIVATGFILAYWDDIKFAITGVNSELVKQNDKLRDANKLLALRQQVQGNLDKAALLRGDITDEEFRAKAQERLNKQIEQEQNLLVGIKKERRDLRESLTGFDVLDSGKLKDIATKTEEIIRQEILITKLNEDRSAIIGANNAAELAAIQAKIKANEDYQEELALQAERERQRQRRLREREAAEAKAARDKELREREAEATERLRIIAEEAKEAKRLAAEISALQARFAPQAIPQTGLGAGLSFGVGLGLFFPPEQIDQFALRLQDVLARWAAFQQGFKQISKEFESEIIQNVFQGILDGILNGGNILDNIGRGLLVAFGNFLSKFGDLLIQFGTASEGYAGLQKALFGGNPFTTAAAAAGVIALGAVLKGVGKSISQSASQGLGGGGSQFAVAGASSTQPIGTQVIGQGQGFGEQRVVFQISGANLIGVLRNANNAAQRVGGGITLD